MVVSVAADCRFNLACYSGFRNGDASLLINADSTAFANRSTSQHALYMSNPVTHGTTCMVHPLLPQNHHHP